MSIYLARISSWLEKRFNAKGSPVIQDLDPSIRAVLTWPSGVEDRYLQGWNRFGMVAFPGAVAAQFAGIRMRSPTAANVLVVMESIFAFSPIADQPRIVYNTGLGDLTPTSVTNARLDSRSNPQPSGAMSSGNVASTTGNALIQRTMQVNVGIEFINNPNQELTVLPGDSLTVYSNVVNQALNCSFIWRERSLELSELT